MACFSHIPYVPSCCLSEVNGALAAAQSKLAALQEELAVIKAARPTASAEDGKAAAAAAAQASNLQRELESARREIGEMAAAAEEATVAQGQLQREVDFMHLELNNKAAELDRMHLKLHERAAEVQALQAELTKAQTDHAEMMSEYEVRLKGLQGEAEAEHKAALEAKQAFKELEVTHLKTKTQLGQFVDLAATLSTTKSDTTAPAIKKNTWTGAVLTEAQVTARNRAANDKQKARVMAKAVRFMAKCFTAEAGSHFTLDQAKDAFQAFPGPGSGRALTQYIIEAELGARGAVKVSGSKKKGIKFHGWKMVVPPEAAQGAQVAVQGGQMTATSEDDGPQ